MVCLTTCLHGVNKVYKEDAGDGAATGNIFCSGEQITERDVTTTPRETRARRWAKPTPTQIHGIGIERSASRRRLVSPPRTAPRPFLIARSPAAKKVTKRQLMQRLLTLGPQRRKGKETGAPSGAAGRDSSVHVKRAQGRVKEVADRPRSYLLNVPKFGARPCDHFEGVFSFAFSTTCYSLQSSKIFCSVAHVRKKKKLDVTVTS
ncbi:unnamed protein product [Lasius platythorax]|uniref:Uncharacterized protein n=1 Tax=Lasius platythorax TaxID=488582 RepID=A0AAV2NU15_9HYME